MVRTGGKSGFTIVELLIVIVVIAILAAITVVAYNGIQQRARASALQNSLAQTEREIMTYALQENSEIISLSGTLVGTQRDGGDSSLLRPLTGTPDITMYIVQYILDTTASYPDYASLAPSSGGQVFRLYGGPTGTSNLGYRVDTSAQTNTTGTISGYRVVGSTVIGWLQVSNNATVRDFGYNQAASQGTAALTAHSGWNFTSLTSAYTNKGVYVFNAAHNQTTRAQVINWLAKKYSVSL